MRVAQTIAETRQLRQALAATVGFVPTMGYLHEGHLALVQGARAENTSVVASIFVNPTQFGPTEDFASYPRDMARDLSLLDKEGVDLVFAPTAEEMYPVGFQTWVEIERLARPLEGAFRPGHFRGVATVVAKLFNIVQAHRAYFGQKDAQQAVVIQRMVADLSWDLEIRVVPTVREADGLALSSRNSYLSPAERQAATVLYRALREAYRRWAEGERRADNLRSAMVGIIAAEPLAHLDYASVSDLATLEELDEVPGPALLAVAVKIGRTRLIDNMVLGEWKSLLPNA